MNFKNQYEPLDAAARSRTTFTVARKDVSLLLSYDPKLGNLQTTLSILLTKLTHELRQSSIEPGDYSAYNAAVCELDVKLPARFYSSANTQRGTTGESPAGTEPHGTIETPNRNVGRRTKKLA